MLERKTEQKKYPPHCMIFQAMAFTRYSDRHQRIICSTSTSKQWQQGSRLSLKGACGSHRHTQLQGCTVLMNAAARSVWTRHKSTANESWIRCPIDLSTFTHVTVDFLPHGLPISIRVTIILHVATLTFHARFPDFTLHICRERASESLPPAMCNLRIFYGSADCFPYGLDSRSVLEDDFTWTWRDRALPLWHRSSSFYLKHERLNIKKKQLNFYMSMIKEHWIK